MATEGDAFFAVIAGATAAVRGASQLKARVSSARAARAQAKLDAEAAAAEAAANEPPSSKKGKGKAGTSAKENKSKPGTPAASGGKDKKKGATGSEHVQEQEQDGNDGAAAAAVTAAAAAETAAQALLSAATEAKVATEWWRKRFDQVGAFTGSLLLAPSGACVQGWAALQEAAVDAPPGGLVAKKAEAPLACRFAAGVEFVELACEAAAKRKQRWNEAAAARCVLVAKAEVRVCVF